MIELSYRMTFNTPAFLGNAEQQAQWRTPPIKALLRQWWRVAYAADQSRGVDVARMRKAEGELFGVAADAEGDSRRSKLRLRLDDWQIGTLTSWDRCEQASVQHDEVERTRGQIGPHAYLGFGPLTVSNRQTTLTKGRAAIQEKEAATLSIAFPARDEDNRLARTLWLLHQYGTLGGRSRNGWGSFSLTPADMSTPALTAPLDEALTLPWREALAQDWPQAIGSDERGPLIWQTEALPDWKLVMRRLAVIKIGLRTQFKFTSGKAASAPEARHWLSYPVTNHSVRDWGNNARLPNSLRFKVRADADGKLRGVIFHVPCLPPAEFRPDRSAITTVWQQVHRYLQDAARLQRIPA